MKIDNTIIIINTLIKNQQYTELSNLIQKIIHLEIEKQNDIDAMILFFSQIYDELYYYIIFNKIPLEKKLIRQLEALSMPIQSRNKKEWDDLFEKIRKNKQ